MDYYNSFNQTGDRAPEIIRDKAFPSLERRQAILFQPDRDTIFLRYGENGVVFTLFGCERSTLRTTNIKYLAMDMKMYSDHHVQQMLFQNGPTEQDIPMLPSLKELTVVDTAEQPREVSDAWRVEVEKPILERCIIKPKTTVPIFSMASIPEDRRYWRNVGAVYDNKDPKLMDKTKELHMNSWEQRDPGFGLSDLVDSDSSDYLY
ncbi:uncharacterized protein PAC_02741 [Phialocephala subalpina]|uniref:Uncharacterized protein n=1 Tax=Phialocephala subalpina TaxID=576137 RepID=A0A1L7WJB9_9HELO|nr:uncharacterized protein PAC_02741 [Phialocephala subalpina]